MGNVWKTRPGSGNLPSEKLSKNPNVVLKYLKVIRKRPLNSYKIKVMFLTHLPKFNQSLLLEEKLLKQLVVFIDFCKILISLNFPRTVMYNSLLISFEQLTKFTSTIMVFMEIVYQLASSIVSFQLLFNLHNMQCFQCRFEISKKVI